MCWVIRGLENGSPFYFASDCCHHDLLAEIFEILATFSKILAKIFEILADFLKILATFFNLLANVNFLNTL